LRVLQQRLQPLDGGEQLLVLLLELLRSRRSAAQRHVQDVVGLDLESSNLAISLVAASVTSAAARMMLDDLVDVGQRDQQALDDVVALLGLAQLEPRPRVTTSTWWSR
jgi:hypothetical protein